MPRYADLTDSFHDELAGGSAKSFEFGPVRWGKIVVQATGIRERRPLAEYEDFATDRPSVPTRVRIQLLDDAGDVVAEGVNQLEHDVFEPTRPVFTVAPTKWKVRVKNLDPLGAVVSASVRYPSWQEIETRFVPVTWFQRKFDALVADGVVPPLTVTIDGDVDRPIRSRSIRVSARTVQDEGAPGGWRIRLRAEIELEDGRGVAVELDLARKGAFIGHEAVDATDELAAAVVAALNRAPVRAALQERLRRLIVGGDHPVLDLFGSQGHLHVSFVKPLPRSMIGEAAHDVRVDPGEDTSANLSTIDHIVFLMMEHRSFDHVLGYLTRERGAPVNGLRGGEHNTHGGTRHESFRLPGTAFRAAPCDHHDCVERQINGGDMGGFVADFALRHEDDGVPPGDVMGYHGPEHVPVYDLLAREFGICDQWYGSLRAATWPNRFFLLSGQLPRDASGRAILDTPEHFSGWDVPCLFDHLTERNVAWRYYEHEVGFIRLFHRYKFDVTRVIDVRDEQRGFFADAAAGRLAPVSFIDPRFVDAPGMAANDDRPPADLRDGQKLVAEIYNALAASPGWPRTLFVITYGGHGGFYDHVSPPLGWGVRVPTFVISPRVPRGLVAGEKLDHTAIVQTIIRRFMRDDPPHMGARVFGSRDLGFMLTEATARTDCPAAIAPTWGSEPEGATATGEGGTARERDFRSEMARFRAHLIAERALRR